MGKLRTLKDETGWKQTEQQLRNDLKALRKLRLIDFETEERSKRPWVIELTGLHVPPSPERLSKASANETGVPRLHTEGAGLQSETAREFASTDNEAFFAALERVRAARAEAFLEDNRGPRTAPSLA